MKVAKLGRSLSEDEFSTTAGIAQQFNIRFECFEGVMNKWKNNTISSNLKKTCRQQTAFFPPITVKQIETIKQCY